MQNWDHDVDRHDPLCPDARRAWLDAAQSDSEEQIHRERSDFLLEVNHDGERLDFHSLRHTCGAWLAMTGAHPKVVQSVMRHSTITLTMDTYGHLFPGQEADAVARVRELLSPPLVSMRAAGIEEAKSSSQIGEQLDASAWRSNLARVGATYDDALRKPRRKKNGSAPP